MMFGYYYYYFLFLHVSIETYALEYMHQWIWYGLIYERVKTCRFFSGGKMLKDMEKLKL